MVDLGVEGELVGRTGALGSLLQAYDRAREGRCVSVLLRGPHGIGKTRLVEELLARLPGEPVVYRSPCRDGAYEPFHAVSAVVDVLVEQLLALPRSRAPLLIPRDAGALGMLFPTLERVPAIADSPRHNFVQVDPIVVRNRGLAAFGALLSRLADGAPVVLFLDQVQWADVDSARLLDELLMGDPGASLLVVMTVDESSKEPCRFLQSLRAPIDIDVALGPLSDDEAAALAARVRPMEEPEARTLAAQAGGHPMLLIELARADPPLPSPPDLSKLIERRIRALEKGARRLLYVTSLHPRPLSAALAARLVDLPEDRLEGAIAALVREGLALASDGGETLEPAHDVVRETARRLLSGTRRRGFHHVLALELRAIGASSSELLFFHYLRAEDPGHAHRYAREAAEGAARAHAFHHAATLYGAAVRTGQVSAATRAELSAECGDNLERAGRGGEAARAWLAAAEDSPPAEAFDLRRRAAAALLSAGEMDRAEPVLRDVLREAGFTPLPSAPWVAYVRLNMLRFLLFVRGFRLTRGGDPLEAKRASALRAAHDNLVWLQPVHGLYYGARLLLAALRAGDPKRAAETFLLYIGAMVIVTLWSLETAEEMVKRAKSMEQPESEETRVLRYRILGVSYFVSGHWAEAHDLLERGRRALGERIWVNGAVEHMSLENLTWLGNLRDLCERLPAAVSEARDRGQIVLSTVLSLANCNLAWLVRDDPDGAERAVEAALHDWPERPFGTPTEWYALNSRVHIALYRGEPAAALTLMTTSWSWLRRSLMLLVPNCWALAHHWRGQAKAALSDDETLEGKRRARDASRDAAKLRRRRRTPYSVPCADLIDAVVALRSGDRAGAVATFAAARAGFDKQRMAMHVAAVDACVGSLTGDEALAEAGRRFFADQGVAAPERMVRMLVPGVLPE